MPDPTPSPAPSFATSILKGTKALAVAVAAAALTAVGGYLTSPKEIAEAYAATPLLVPVFLAVFTVLGTAVLNYAKQLTKD